MSRVPFPEQDSEEAFKQWSDGVDMPMLDLDVAALRVGFLAGCGKGFRAGGSYVGREMRENASRDGGGSFNEWTDGGRDRHEDQYSNAQEALEVGTRPALHLGKFKEPRPRSISTHGMMMRPLLLAALAGACAADLHSGDLEEPVLAARDQEHAGRPGGCTGGGKGGCSAPVGAKWDRWDMAAST